MEAMQKGTKVKIVKCDIDGFVGKSASADVHIGQSGETQLFNLSDSGGALYLRHDEVQVLA